MFRHPAANKYDFEKAAMESRKLRTWALRLQAPDPRQQLSHSRLQTSHCRLHMSNYRFRTQRFRIQPADLRFGTSYFKFQAPDSNSVPERQNQNPKTQDPKPQRSPLPQGNLQSQNPKSEFHHLREENFKETSTRRFQRSLAGPTRAIPLAARPLQGSLTASPGPAQDHLSSSVNRSGACT